jgi:hypothetical protein
MNRLEELAPAVEADEPAATAAEAAPGAAIAGQAVIEAPATETTVTAAEDAPEEGAS